MANEHQGQPTEQTPKGLTVPVPRREDFLANLKRVAKPQTPPKRPEQSGMRGKGNRRYPGGSGKTRSGLPKK
jgi:hypothetical protein